MKKITNLSLWLIFISLLVIFQGCITEDEAKRRENTARQKALQECMMDLDIKLNQAFEKGKQEGIDETIFDAEKKIKDAAELEFAKGKAFSFVVHTIGFLEKTYPELTGLALGLFLVAILISILKKTLLPTLSKKIISFFRERRWDIKSCFGQINKITIELEKWQFKNQQVDQEMKNAKLQIKTAETQITEYEGFISRGVEKTKEDCLHKEIFLLKSRIDQLRQFIEEGLGLRNKIKRISNGLCADIAYIRNSGKRLPLINTREAMDAVGYEIDAYLKYDLAIDTNTRFGSQFDTAADLKSAKKHEPVS